MRFSPDGNTIITVSRDGTVKRWRLDGEELNTIKYDDVFESVSFGADGKIMASTSGDNTVQLWSVDGEKLTTLFGHDDAVMNVRFSPDGRTLATASKDTSVKLWNLDVDKWVSLWEKDLDDFMIEACHVVKHYLKNTENKSHSNLCDGMRTSASTSRGTRLDRNSYEHRLNYEREP